MRRKTRHWTGVCALLLLLASGCGEYEKLEIEKSARRTADSLYRVTRDSLTIGFQEDCRSAHDSMYRYYFDSLSQTEAQKIKQLLER